MKTIGIVAKWNHPEALGATCELYENLGHRGFEVMVLRSSLPLEHALPATEAEEMGERAALLVVLGGDGTLIHTAALVCERSTPIFGVNLGTLGFLAEIELADLYPALEMVLQGHFLYEDRMRLRVRLVRRGEVVLTRYVVNDAVVTKGDLARILDFEVSVGAELLSHYKGDGILVATPTGSTAYNLAAGGPVVQPNVPGVIITPICPHALTQRPIVIGDQSTIRIRALGSEGRAFLTADGQEAYELLENDVVEISRSPFDLRLVRAPARSFFAVLHQKLKWGSR